MQERAAVGRAAARRLEEGLPLRVNHLFWLAPGSCPAAAEHGSDWPGWQCGTFSSRHSGRRVCCSCCCTAAQLQAHQVRPPPCFAENGRLVLADRLGTTMLFIAVSHCCDSWSSGACMAGVWHRTAPYSCCMQTLSGLNCALHAL